MKEATKKIHSEREGTQAENEDCEVRCPYCFEDNRDLWDREGLIGISEREDRRYEFHCGSCSQIFYVEEWVSRTYTSYKSEGRF